MVWALQRRKMLLPSLVLQVSVLLLACALEDSRTVQDRHLAAVDPSCAGFEEEKAICPGLQPCELCKPRHCKFGDWGDWSDMGGCHELCERSRGISVKNNECGVPCEGLEKTTKRCPKASCYTVKQDCAYSAWTAWNSSKCTNPQEQQRRYRWVTKETQGANKTECKGLLTETKPCEQKNFPLDCDFSIWSQWSACSATCDTGYRHRERTVTKEAAHGGSCPSVPLAVTEKCVVAACNKDVDCVFGQWSDWSVHTAAYAGNTKQWYRSRNIATAAENEGKRCLGPMYEMKGAEKGSGDCSFDTWAAWTTCTKSCGSGQKSRTRHMSPFSGIGACPASALEETTSCNTQTCGDACVYSAWSDWTAPPGTTHDYACSSLCGVGTKARHRVVSTSARDCMAALLELAPCVGSYGNCNLLQDCVWGDWQGWSDCSVSCGNGTHKRNRTVLTPPEKDGKPCDPLAKEQVDTCNLGDCGLCKDAVWSDWTAWNQCSTTCDTGFKTRSRNASKANHCGKPAIGPNSEFVNCTGPPCVSNADCVVGQWTSWSTCSKTCYGITRRTRSIQKPASGDGKSCDETLEEMTACNPGVGGVAAPACAPKAVEDCQLGDWQQWTQCTANCGGLRERNRAFVQLPTHGGKTCNTSALGVLESCNVGSCTKAVCVDCKWSAWKEWDACGMCKGQQSRTRHIEEMPTNCGKPCDERTSEETRNCTGACPEMKFCVFTEWVGDNVSQCNVQPCGQNTFRQSRNMKIVDTVVAGQTVISQGTAATLICNGVEHRTGKCAPKPCDKTCSPQDCSFGDWGPWEQPTCSGSVTRQRAIVAAAKCGGAPCTGPLAESKPGMALDCNLPFDCQFSDWTAWTPCGDDLTAQRTSTRTIKQMPRNGGQGCAGSMMITRGCNNPTAPKNCVFANWEDWSACPVTCNGDLQKRKRLVQQNAESNGELCSGSDEEVRSCGTQDCPAAVGAKTCEWQQWSAWECNGLTNQKTRTRTFLHTTPELLLGACIGEFRQIAPCDAEDWTVPSWTPWGMCDKTCGGGQRKRTREGVQPPAGRDTTPESALPKNVPLVEISACNTMICPGTEASFADCNLTAWTAWTPCSSSCGTGFTERSRTANNRAVYGKGCDSMLYMIAPCQSPTACPTRVDCRWSDWSAWSACNAQCGGGEKTRRRSVAQAPLFGGASCANHTKEEIQPCNTDSCQAKLCVDGAWNDWGAWSTCKGANVSGMSACTTDTSSLGVQERTRSVKTAANDCGVPIHGPSRQIHGCVLPLCPSFECKFGAWNDWSTCPGACDGTKKRHRNITQVGSPDKACVGELQQITNCTPCHAPVPVDCKFSPWFEGECSVSCGGGRVVKTRSILEEAKNGGKACEGSLKIVAKCAEKACNTFAPVDCLWGDWKPWGNCSAKCGDGGQRKRKRDIAVLPLHAGKACEAGDSEEQEGCSSDACPKTYCTWGDWQAWGNCSATCGNATKTRRRYLNSSYTAPGEAGGIPKKEVFAKYAEIRAQLEETESSRWKDLSTAFALGAIACSVVLFAMRACGFRRSSPTYSQISAHDNTNTDYEGLQQQSIIA